ncbi:MAG TPA: ABC transporter ATP-binding protein [Steroidobacteraceae bacterium]|nr:ABC transporter ATP-binding protein [Steroidobacteraceae bacterium]
MHALQVEAVSRCYAAKGAAAPLQALREVSLTLHPGEILAVLGLNGAGKTTLVKVLSGLIRPDSGAIRLGAISSASTRAYLQRIGAVFEGNRNIYWRLTAFENLHYFALLRGLGLRRARQRALEMLALFGLAERRATLAAHLSRGMQQRLAVAIALVHEPAVVLLDEPTLGVDLENVLQIVATLKLLRERGIAIVLTSHQLDVVRMLADRIALLVGGRVAALESLGTFLARSASHSYTLELAEPIDAARQQRLGALGVTQEQSRLRFGPAVLYDVIDALRPLRVGSLQYCEADLASGFLSRIRDYRDAQPAAD